MYNPPRILTPAEWPRIAGVMHDVFHNAMPTNPHQSSFDVIETTDGEIAIFANVETVFNLNALYVAPAHRGNASLLLSLMRDVDARLKKAKGFSVICMLDENKTELGIKCMLERLGGRDLGMCRVIRRDYE